MEYKIHGPLPLPVISGEGARRRGRTHAWDAAMKVPSAALPSLELKMWERDGCGGVGSGLDRLLS